MAHEYVFRGERMPFAPDPKEEQAREQARRDAEKLVTREPATTDQEPADIHEVERRLDDYQVGGLDAFGTAADSPDWDDASVSDDEQSHAPASDDRPRSAAS
jgi:hypothetical protein